MSHQQQSANRPSPPSTSFDGAAHVNFRVRCETLGHGESIFLVPAAQGQQQQQQQQQNSVVGLQKVGLQAERHDIGSFKDRWIRPLYARFSSLSFSLRLDGLFAVSFWSLTFFRLFACCNWFLYCNHHNHHYYDHNNEQSIPLHTTPAQFPWFHSLTPLTLSLPSQGTGPTNGRPKAFFRYRYAVHRAGVFHRWEQASDGPSPDEVGTTGAAVTPSRRKMERKVMAGTDGLVSMVDVDEAPPVYSRNVQQDTPHHEVPLHLLAFSASPTVL